MLALRIGDDISYETRIKHEIHFAWQAQYLLRLEARLTLLAPRILNDVSYVTRINHEMHFAWQAQYLVRFEVDFACSAHFK